MRSSSIIACDSLLTGREQIISRLKKNLLKARSSADENSREQTPL